MMMTKGNMSGARLYLLSGAVALFLGSVSGCSKPAAGKGAESPADAAEKDGKGGGKKKGARAGKNEGDSGAETEGAETEDGESSEEATADGASSSSPGTSTATKDSEPERPKKAPRPEMSKKAAKAFKNGQKAFAAGDLQGAKAQYKAATEADPKAYEAHYAQGVVEERLGRFAAARAARRQQKKKKEQKKEEKGNR